MGRLLVLGSGLAPGEWGKRGLERGWVTEGKGDGDEDFWQHLGEGTRWPSCTQSWVGVGWGPEL